MIDKNREENFSGECSIGRDELRKSMKALRAGYLAEHSDILLAYVKRGNSGSAQTLRMATGKCKEIYNLYAALEKQKNLP